MPTNVELEQNLKAKQAQMLDGFGDMLGTMLRLFRRMEIGRDEVVAVLLKAVDTAYGRVQ